MKSSKLPLQSAPVERTVTGATLSTQSGVDPSFWGALASTLLPIAGKAISGLLS